MQSTSILAQIVALIVLVVLFFFLASSLRQRVATTLMMLLVPFQAIDSFIGTSTTILAYVVFIALLIRGIRVHLPMFGILALIVIWCMVSMGIQHQSTYLFHGIYIYTLVSAALVFWLCYDLTHRFDRPASIIDVFVWMNFFVAIYSAFQLWLGPGERFVLFGIDEIHMTRVRADGRLTGPFQSAEITAQYLVIMVFVILQQLWYAETASKRRWLIGLIALDVGLLVATAARGEFMVLIGGFALYLWLFRKRLGVVRAISLAVGGATILTAMAVVVVSYTEFGDLFERLEQTEIEGGIPDTRSVVWPQTWREIQDSPIVGHGPSFTLGGEHHGDTSAMMGALSYPHSLYLFLLYTIGVPGLILFLIFIVRVLLRCARALSKSASTPYWQDLARTGVLVIILFLIDGIKIEQMRLNLADYWHFWFGLCGVFVAACQIIENETEGVARIPLNAGGVTALRAG